MNNYSKILKQVRKVMNKTKATRYWGTLVLLVITYLLGVVITQLPVLIPLIQGAK